MNEIYKKILNDYSSDNDFIKALLANDKMIYFYLSQLIIKYSPAYRNLGNKDGKNPAGQVLMDTLIVFRRQVENEKISISFKGNKIFIKTRGGLELSEYLSRLFLLIYETSPFSPDYKQSDEFEKKLISGKGFEKLYGLKNSIQSTLRNFGCTQQQDQEDIFHDSLIIFWRKLVNGEFGIYFTGEEQNLENCQVYHCKFYQNSTLHTFLTGIAKNLFMNRTRSAVYKTSSDSEPTNVPEDQYGTIENKHDNPVLILFFYYRHFIEKRKLRTIISILQHDCNLEEIEIKNILGINNARIHSSRLKSHFLEWYDQNQNKEHEIADTANNYFNQREAKKGRLNKKIGTIDRYHRNQVNQIDLDIYQEEFHTLTEFNENGLTFKQAFYFTSVGRQSALTGLPDEEKLKEAMLIFKKELDSLTRIQVLFFLLFYGSDESRQVLIDLVKSLYLELKESGQNQGSASNLTQQLEKHQSLDQPALTNELYQINCLLFDTLSKEDSFQKLTTQDETV